MLNIIDLTKSFKKRALFKNLNIEFIPAVYGLLGPNGSGKTTLMRCLTNLYRYNGMITYEGKNIIDNNSYFNRLGYLPQKLELFKDLSVREMMEYFAALNSKENGKQNHNIKACLDMVNLSDRFNDKVRTLSGGMVRRLGIAQAILNNPTVLLLDEPTSGLDPEERIRFQSLISLLRKDRIIIISTHIVEDVEAVCNQIIVLHNGRILTYGDCSIIREIAKDKVFEIYESDISFIKGDYYLAKRFIKSGKTMYRILTKDAQQQAAVSSTIEDGYLWALKWL